MACVLGISAFYHDSAAVLVRDGEIVAAAQEERFSRRKHDPRFPKQAINYCLGEAFIDPSGLDAVVFYDNPLLTLDRVTKNALAVAPAGADQFVAACNTLLGVKATLRTQLEACLGLVPRLLLTPHHMAHAASCFLPSPFESAAILTIDGVGEWATCTLGAGSGATIELLSEIRYPHSLGLLYSAFTSYCGFKVNSGEYKLMGLAPYGEPRYASLIRDSLIDVKDDGSFRLDTQAFGYLDSGVMTNSRFHGLFDGPPRQPDSLITRREMDLAASVQLVVEDIVLKLTSHVMRLTGQKTLVMAGGVALNCVANGRVLRESGLDGLFVQPSAGDAGGALGAALLVEHQIFKTARTVIPTRDSLKGSYLGPAYSSQEVADFLDRMEAPSTHVPDPDERARTVARALADGQVVGFFNGRMEYGPRALGARSILGDPRRPDMQSTMNMKIKFRESFRPFAPAVLARYAQDYFDLEQESPYMLVTAPVQSWRRLPLPSELAEAKDMHCILNQPRSDVPAVTHVDYSARVQTVGLNANQEFRRLLEEFHALTGCPLLVNTSFNVRGEPIVCSPQDAYRCFMNTGIDLLVLQDQLLWKDRQPVTAREAARIVEYEAD
ncbi:MAG TPA: carbamoyltransferase N-terminal domain-containing protein [Caldimonas sp.]|jgi:carbamoyltransferase|nr:carbamoyltransferase N-terminal domain-containing protein [Caldimonas sp.]HEX2541507.1 carbamoyltransferase N-terminal domain-containing protein [Caldimonas sp.]